MVCQGVFVFTNMPRTKTPAVHDQAPVGASVRPARSTPNRSPSVHPMQGDEIRGLRRMQREQSCTIEERAQGNRPVAIEPCGNELPYCWSEKVGCCAGGSQRQAGASNTQALAECTSNAA